MEETPRYISFDLDNTLVSVSFDKELYNEIIPRRYAEKEDIPLADAKQYVYATYYEAKYIDQVTDWTSIRRWLNTFGLGDEKELLERLRRLSEAYDDVKTTLPGFDVLADLTVFSNTNPNFLDIKTSIPPLDDHIGLAKSGPYDYDHAKDERAAWEAYLDDLDVDPDNIIHVGDDIAEDVETPESLGITTYHLNRDNNPKGKGYGSLHAILNELRTE